MLLIECDVASHGMISSIDSTYARSAARLRLVNQHTNISTMRDDILKLTSSCSSNVIMEYT